MLKIKFSKHNVSLLQKLVNSEFVVIMKGGWEYEGTLSRVGESNGIYIVIGTLVLDIDKIKSMTYL